MKPRRQNKPAAKKKSGGGTLLGLFLGLVIGVLVAAGVVWYINKMPVPFTTTGQQPPAASGKPQPNGAAVSAAPAPLPGKPGDPIPPNSDKPRFDFYKILPGNADAIPDPKPADAKQADVAKGKGDKEKDKEAALKEPLFLQTGSFQNAGDADNQKAKLALSGLEASVQQVMVQDKVWFRVRLGPFGKMDELTRTRADLAKQGVEANVVKKD
jgi:cell division protein FtsN